MNTPASSPRPTLAVAAAAPLLLAAAAHAGSDVLINEVRVDQAGTDTNEYFELAGPPGLSVADLTYLVIGDEVDTPNPDNSGVIETVVPLAGQAIRPNGFLVVAEATFTLGLPNAIADLNFENSDNVTHLLVQNFTGVLGQDLDLDDDGVLDVMPWSTVVDCVALVEPGIPGVDGEHVYCAEVIGPDDMFMPAHVYRCSPDGTWTIGEFDLSDPGASDTPGAVNTPCDFAPPCGADLAGDCFVANGTPFCDDLACCQLVIDNFNPACAIVWDQTCADLALVNCRACGDPEAGDCFEPNGTPYCNIASCCDTVCSINPLCCQVSGWDQTCADLADANCIIESPQQGDVIIGHSDSVGEQSMDLARGPAVLDGGVQLTDAWTEPFIQSVEFDNLGGLLHNPAGNILGVNFGPGGGTGGIYNIAACQAVGPGQLIGDTVGLGGAGLTLSRLTGISVSPDNTKIAVAGYDSGRVIVYDYVAGNCMGAGASLSGARETSTAPLCPGDTQGTAWLDNNTVLAYSSVGFLYTIDAGTMVASPVQLLPGNCPSAVTDIEYNPAVAPYIYCMDGTFSGATANTLTVVDPSAAFAVVGTFDYSTSMNTAREIALDRAGNLFVSEFSGTVELIQDAGNLASLADNLSLDWYVPFDGSGFNGLDVAVGVEGKGEPCPWDCGSPSDGVVDTIDFLALLAQWGMVGSSCDFDNTGVDTVDFLALLANWGDCP